MTAHMTKMTEYDNFVMTVMIWHDFCYNYYERSLGSINQSDQFNSNSTTIMATQILNLKSCSALLVHNSCTKRGQIHSIYKHGVKFLVDENANHTEEDGYVQFIAWSDDFISFKPRQTNEIYNGQQKVMTVEQMEAICEIINFVDMEDIEDIESIELKINVDEDGNISLAGGDDTEDKEQQEKITLVNEKVSRSRRRKMLKTNSIKYGLASYEFVEELAQSNEPCLQFLTENEWIVYKAIVRAMEQQMRDVIRASDVVQGDHAIAGTISTLNMKGFVRCRVGGDKHGKGFISAVTTKNYNDFSLNR
nr:MAG TPA: hypothetical protein [Caudoviricetes sp.]